jgi:PEP-CTERM motif
MFQKTSQPWNRSRAAMISVGLTILWGFSSVAHAVVITAGLTKNTTGETAPAFTPSDLLYDSGDVVFTGVDNTQAVVFTGELDSKVYTDPSTGDLDFVYQFTNDPTSEHYILNFGIGLFSGYTTDADYLLSTGSVTPDTVQRNTANAGGSLDFNFSPAVASGNETAEMIVKTNSTAYTLNGLASLADGGTANINAPAPVPEPATFAIAGFALLALGSRRRSSRR